MRLIPPNYSFMDTPPSQRVLLYNGGILWILLSLFLAIIPALLLPIGILLKVIIILIILFIPFIGEVIQFIAIIWGLVVLFTSPFTVLSILFIIAVLAHFWFVFSPFIINTVFIYIMEHRSNK